MGRGSPKEGTKPYPEEVLVMAEKYKTPSLCNHYCAKDHYAGKSCNGSFVSDHFDKKRAQPPRVREKDSWFDD